MLRGCRAAALQGGVAAAGDLMPLRRKINGLMCGGDVGGDVRM